ncbi:MAG: chromosomal replication initiator protein DnaA [Gemmatimonadaceae bacterium]
MHASEAADKWERLVTFARRKLSEHSFHSLTATSIPADFNGKVLTLVVPDHFTARWNEEKFGTELASYAPQALGHPISLKFEVQENRPQRMQMDLFVEQSGDGTRAQPSSQGLKLNSRYTFENFVVGKSNELAAAAASAIAEAPGQVYNPLFVYGPTGLGKTHLMHAIGHAIFARHSDRRIRYLPAEDFTNAYIAAIQHRSMQQFRRQFRELDVLLIDDVHFLRGKEATQEEFFHTFNTLYEAGRQIVVTSDRAPAEIPGIEARLVSRFQWGTVVNIDYPDAEHRTAILKKKLQSDRLAQAIPAQVLELLSQNSQGSIRDLEGAVVTLLAFASLRKQPITVLLAQEALRIRGIHLHHRSQQDSTATTRVTISQVQATVAALWNTTPDGLRSKSRLRVLTLPRQAAMLLCRDLIGSTLNEIGSSFGGRDHSTVIHSLQRAELEASRSKDFHVKLTAARQILSTSEAIPSKLPKRAD